MGEPKTLILHDDGGKPDFKSGSLFFIGNAIRSRR